MGATSSVVAAQVVSDGGSSAEAVEWDDALRTSGDGHGMSALNDNQQAEALIPEHGEQTSLQGSKRVAGSTFSSRSGLAHSWAPASPALFHVRIGPNYARNKQKAPSSCSIYEPIAVDIFHTLQPVDAIAEHFQLPSSASINTGHAHIPPLLIIQLQIPSAPPSLFAASSDGPGWSIVTYHQITPQACRQLEDMTTASAGVRLFAAWAALAPSDPVWRARFKVICQCPHLHELGFPSVITSFNSKPVLIRRTGSLLVGQGYLQMTVSVHKFAHLARQSIHSMTSRINEMMNLQMGFLIEGREDSELPEVLLAGVAVNQPQMDKVASL